MPRKRGGVVTMLLSILILLILPELSISLREGLVGYFFFQVLFWFWVGNFCVLTWLGLQAAAEPYII